MTGNDRNGKATYVWVVGFVLAFCMFAFTGVGTVLAVLSLVENRIEAAVRPLRDVDSAHDRRITRLEDRQ